MDGYLSTFQCRLDAFLKVTRSYHAVHQNPRPWFESTCSCGDGDIKKPIFLPGGSTELLLHVGELQPTIRADGGESGRSISLPALMSNNATDMNVLDHNDCPYCRA